GAPRASPPDGEGRVTGAVAEIVFDVPLRRCLSRVIPSGLTLAPGQRVLAPLQGRPRAGLVVFIRQGETEGLARVQTPMEPVAALSRAMLDLGLWAAAESLSSPGSPLAAPGPPPPRRTPGPARAAAAPARRRRIAGAPARARAGSRDVAGALDEPRPPRAASRGDRARAWGGAGGGARPLFPGPLGRAW